MRNWTVECVSTHDVDITTSKELSVVIEITSVLKEWQVMWKQLFVKNNAEGVKDLRPLLNELMNQRRQVISGALTADQLKQFRLEIAYTIDYGNRYLGLDLVVRDTEGSLIDVDSTGVIDLYKRHLEPAQRTEVKPGDFRKGRIHQCVSLSQYNLHNLYVSVKNVVSKVGDDADVFITLYDGNENAFISEHYVIGWDKNGMPKDLDKLQNLTCLFADLGVNDLQRDKLYIVCQVIRDGFIDSKKDETKKVLTKKLRRPFGVAVLHVSDIVTGKKEEDLDKETFVPLLLLGNDDVETCIKKIIQKVPAQVQGTGQGIWLILQMMHGDFNHIREEYSLLINQYTGVARKIGFPDVIMPGDVRNDLYLTLVSANFERGGKTSSKNIQVTVGVYDSAGRLLENVVSIGTGEPMASEHISTVYYHNANPKWNEVVKLSIPVEKVNGSTIRFVFKHRATADEKDKSQKIFSVSYVNLVDEDGTCLQDGAHELAVYKCEGKKSDDNAYLKLPSLKNKIPTSKKTVSAGNFHFSKTETFKISTKLCSTKLAQNVDLLGLLKWRSQKENLHLILPALMKVSGEEIVKFLQDTFDALFAILMYDAERYGVMVSDAVVFCIGLLADRKYHNFRPILDAYIENLFSSTKAYITMLSALQRNLDYAESFESGGESLVQHRNLERSESLDFGGDSQDQVKRYFKAVEYFMKFIVRSRVLSESATPGVGAEDFMRSIHTFFQTIIRIMKVPNTNLIIIKGCALKYIPAVFGDLLNVYDPVQLGNFALEMIESIPQGTLLTPKLTCIHQIVKSPLFRNQKSREVLLPMLVRQLKINMLQFEELQVCADILNEILSSFVRTEMGDTDRDIEYIALNLFHRTVETVIRIYQNQNPIVGNFVAIIVSVLDLMKEHHYVAYISSYKDDYELLDTLMELFLVFREFVKGNIYPTDWVLMSMIQNNVILGALQHFSDYALSERFLVGDSFQVQLWDNFFQMTVAFITQGSLQLETFSETKRNNILEKYSDMRMVMGNMIIEMWHRLGINKMRLLTSVVRPFLEMTLIPETDLRKTTIPVFYDMISCEFRLRQHFKQVESEIIMQLDHLIETGMKGDEEYKVLFCQILGDLLQQSKETNPRLSELGLIFVETITKLLTRLLDYRSVISSEDNINNRMSCSVNILNFYQDIKREEMKERYLYKLCDLHLSVKSFTEAAFTLLQHAELLKFVNEPLNNANTNFSSNRYNVKTQWELKERLYIDSIDYFDKGKMWEYGIKKCKELAEQYELETYDYVKLSKILGQEAQFFENIMKTVIRPEPTYFRVGYFGRGFPTFLRNKLFIQRGDEFEKLSDFTMRMRILFPVAEFLNTLEPPGEDITESVQKWIQICKVDPRPVERRKFQGKNIADQIKKFYEVNDVSEFTLNRPFHKGKKDKENEFATLWIERITMNTEFTFPGKLRWFEVTSISKVELSPIENAVDTMRTKNKEVTTLISQHTADTTLNYNNLSMVLNGTIDAAVMGGYANYEKIFFSKDYMSSHPDESIFIDILKECIVEQVDLCEKALLIHKKIISKELEPFQKKMEDQLKQNKTKAMPYRKHEEKKKAFGGDKKVFAGRTLRSEISSSPRVDHTAPPIPPSRRTMMDNLTSPGQRHSGFRHTAIVGSSSLAEDFLREGGDFDSLPSNEQERVMTMTLGRKPKHAPPSRLASNDTSTQEAPSDVKQTESPPTIPRKLKRTIKPVANNIESDTKPDVRVTPSTPKPKEDDEPPPLLPKKASKKNPVAEASDSNDEISGGMTTNKKAEIQDKYINVDKPNIALSSTNDNPIMAEAKRTESPSSLELNTNSEDVNSSGNDNINFSLTNQSKSENTSINDPPIIPKGMSDTSQSHEDILLLNNAPIIPKKASVMQQSHEAAPLLSNPPIVPKKVPAIPPFSSQKEGEPAPVIPKKAPTMYQSHEDALQLSSPPILPKKVTDIPPSQSQEEGPEPSNISPVILQHSAPVNPSPRTTRRMPVIPPPFGSVVNGAPETPSGTLHIETSNNDLTNINDELDNNDIQEIVPSGDREDEEEPPPPPIPPRQKKPPVQ